MCIYCLCHEKTKFQQNLQGNQIERRRLPDSSWKREYEARIAIVIILRFSFHDWPTILIFFCVKHFMRLDSSKRQSSNRRQDRKRQEYLFETFTSVDLGNYLKPTFICRGPGV